MKLDDAFLIACITKNWMTPVDGEGVPLLVRWRGFRYGDRMILLTLFNGVRLEAPIERWEDLLGFTWTNDLDNNWRNFETKLDRMVNEIELPMILEYFGVEVGEDK